METRRKRKRERERGRERHEGVKGLREREREGECVFLLSVCFHWVFSAAVCCGCFSVRV